MSKRRVAIPAERAASDELKRWRHLNACTVLERIADYVKEDGSFKPRAHLDTRRFHATCNGHEFEVLTSGPKWFDTRALRGGGGAVDVVMHFYGYDFKTAVAYLRRVGI